MPTKSVVDQLSQTVDLLSIQSDLSQQPSMQSQPMGLNNMYPAQQQAYYGYAVPPQQHYMDPNAVVSQQTSAGQSKGSFTNFDPFA
jgi:hypothetical protein